MEVKNKTMYHLHKSNEYDDIWQEKNTLLINDDFEGYATKAIDDYNTFAPLSTSETLDTKIYNCIQKERLDQIELISLLIEARSLIYKSNILKREAALEEIRKAMFPNLPSRKHSLFVTTKDGLDYWRKKLVPAMLSHNLALFELSLTGNLFRTNSQLLPKPESTYKEARLQGLYYWDPDLKNVDNEKDEYLFQGKAEIVKQLKM